MGRLSVTPGWGGLRHRPRTWLPVSHPPTLRKPRGLTFATVPHFPGRPAGVLRKPAGHTVGAPVEPIGRRGRPAGLGIGTCGPDHAPSLAPGAGGIPRRGSRGCMGGPGDGIGRSEAPPLPLFRPDLPAAGSPAEPASRRPRDSSRQAHSHDIMVAYWRQAGLR